jgi:integrase/recombinase XerD
MRRHRIGRRVPIVSTRRLQKIRLKEATLVRKDFGDYLRALGYSPYTIKHYQRRLLRLANWLNECRGSSQLSKLTRKEVPRLLACFLPSRRPETQACFRRALFQWLRFQGRYVAAGTQLGWQRWLDDYLDFLRTHRGVGDSTIQRAQVNVNAFLHALFGRGRANWARVQALDIWRFARQHVRGVKPSYAKDRLGQVRRFLRFVLMQGACSQQLLTAFPKVALRGSSTRPEILSEQQERTLLTCFDRKSPEGKRDYAMTLCMLHLGLRSVEVSRLKITDIDWKRRVLNVPPAKNGCGRRLPIPRRVFRALRDYVKTGRPKDSSFAHLFLRHPRRRGHPLSGSALRQRVLRAYRRCGFPQTWSGTHRLRHTFASRLHRRGVDLKPIADLLGHRSLSCTTIYTHIAPEELAGLAQPWPR